MTVTLTTRATAGDRVATFYRNVLDRDFWTQLGHGLQVSDVVRPEWRAEIPLTDGQIGRCIEQLTVDGYFSTGRVFPRSRTEAMADLVARFRHRSLHWMFCLLYDDFWITVAEADRVLSRAMGGAYRTVPLPYVHFVDDDGEGVGLAPHRDCYVSPCGDDGLPRTMTAWISLTDAAADRACLYVLPASRDPNFPDSLEKCELVSVQDIVAVPVSAGALVCFNQGVLHWSGRNNRFSGGPRISYAFEFQRIDDHELRSPSIDLHEPVTFETRLAFVAQVMLMLSERNVPFKDDELTVAHMLVEQFE